MKILLLIPILTISFMSQAQIVIGHRGAKGLAPENTLASIEKAFELGVQAVEIDVRMTADSQIVLMHDASTRRTSGGKSQLVIKDSNLDQLTKVNVAAYFEPAYPPQYIPTLKTVLKELPSGKEIMIEVKCGTEIIPSLIEVIDESGKIKQCAFLSFEWETIIELNNTFPNNTCLYITKEPKRLRKMMKKASKMGLTGLNIKHSITTKRIMRKARRLKLDIYCWTVNKPEDYKTIQKLKVKGFSTDFPNQLVSK